MEEKEKNSGIVPEQKSGKAIDAESRLSLNDDREAKDFFERVKNKLQNVNQWKDYAGNISATFQLIDERGQEVQRPAQRGDYFKIDIPGPGSESGKGYDWVQIEDVVDKSTSEGEIFGFRVRPVDNPLGEKDDVAHFYSKDSTSSFLVERRGNLVTASVHDRNTKPNEDAESTIDKIRDAVVGAAGVMTFSKVQWQNLTDGLVKR